MLNEKNKLKDYLKNPQGEVLKSICSPHFSSLGQHTNFLSFSLNHPEYPDFTIEETHRLFLDISSLLGKKIIQNNEKFPTQIKVGKVEKNVSYEYKIYSVDNINEKVDLKNVKSIYNNSSDIVKLNDYLRKNTKGFCAMLYKMWDLKNYPTYEENFEMFMRP